MSSPHAPVRFTWLAALLALASSPVSLSGQGSLTDFQRSADLRRITANTVFRDQIEPHWLPGNTRFWYEVRTGPQTREYVLVDAEKGERRLAFDHERMAAGLRKAGLAFARHDQMVLRDLAWSEDGSLSFTGARKQWKVALSTYEVLEQTEQATPATNGMAPAESPKGSRRTGEETSLRFVNHTSAPVQTFWLDFEGQRRAYRHIPPGGAYSQPTYGGHLWLVTDLTGEPLAVFEARDTPGDALVTGAVQPKVPAPPATNTVSAATVLEPLVAGTLSPDGKWSARMEEDNVVVREIASGREFPLSTDGHPGNAYRDHFSWSPDSRKLMGVRAEPGEEHKVAFVESSPADRVEPVLHTFNYYKPGDQLPHPRPVLWDVPSRRPIPIDDALFATPFTERDTLEVRWARDSSRFVFRYNQRGHQVLRIIAIDANTGAASVLVDEQSRTFITHSSGKAYSHWLDESGELIWMSERDGWNHLYLYDTTTGRVKNQITRGEWVVRSVDHVDHARRQIWFQAGGIVPGQDPYYVHYCRVNFDGSSLVVMTEGDGTHGGRFSPDRRFVIDRYSRVDLPPVTTLRRTSDGAFICELERASADALRRTGWRPPERFVAKGRDGVTDIFGVIVRPSGFDPARRYPVIEHIYSGPHGAFAPKAFSPQVELTELAELGFVVVMLDGMGTSGRSKAFHDVCWQNLADAGLPDRVLWIKAAAAKYPQLDLGRVGIYGVSAGGQSALAALLLHRDFYHVAVSDCGCHDNRMDKIWWNEQWMGWPIGPHYAAQSNATLAPRLQGKLLLMVGEMDRNVDPASTLQVANALIKADKDFDLLVVPGAGHGVSHTPYGKRRLQDFFVRHLLGREPRWSESGAN